MLAQFQTAIAAAPYRSLEALSKTVWKALAAGQITDVDADTLSMALEARKAVLLASFSTKPSTSTKPRPRAVTAPQKAAAIERRRRQASSGAIPPDIAKHFTTGEQAVLTVMAREIRRTGACAFVMDKLAALAGVCRTTARNALRRAQQLGLIRVTERRIRWWRNLSNIVTLVCVDWRKWLRIPRRQGWMQKSDEHDHQATNRLSTGLVLGPFVYSPSPRPG